MHNRDNFPFIMDESPTDYSVFDPFFYEEFPVQPVPGTLVFWINGSWFRSQGVDLTDAANLTQARQWLLDNFAFGVASGLLPATEWARADRYGGYGGTAHGGSGRCAYKGRFNAKGVGATPLVPAGLSSHCDGHFHLTEAIRGAIFSELAHHETVSGAVRTVAILALPPFDIAPEERRCIVVRPNFVRPAHFERSLFFGTSGYIGSDQQKDHARVQSVRRVLATCGLSSTQISAALARQIGSLDAMRMSQGRFTSSNMTLEGQIADFDSFRIFDSWFYTKNINRDRYPFGKDIELLKASAQRWAQLLGDTPGAPMRHLDVAHRLGFSDALEFAIPASSALEMLARDRLVAVLYEAFMQSRGLARAHANDWIVDPDITSEAYLERMLAMAESQGFDSKRSLVVASRLNMWRQGRSKLSLQQMIDFASETIASWSGDSASTTAAFDHLIAINRRMIRYPSAFDAPILTVASNNGFSIFAVDISSLEFRELRWDHTYTEGLQGNWPLIVPCSRSKVDEFIERYRSGEESGDVDLCNAYLLDNKFASAIARGA